MNLAHLPLVLTVSACASTILALLVLAAGRGATPAVRSVVWNAAMLASAIGPVAWALAPKLQVTVPAVAAIAVDLGPTAGTAADPILATAAADHPLLPRRRIPGEFLLFAWAAGFAIVVVRFSRQLLLARRLVKRAVSPGRRDLDSVLAEARATLGIGNTVRVLESPEIDVPIAAGVFSPAVVLPADSSAWSRQTLRLVLLHELAHVRRGDVRARGIAMLACAIHWFNPFVWMLSELSRRDAELAADDLVVGAGVKPSSYADTLLTFAENILARGAPEPAMLFIRRRFLSQRVHSILRAWPSRELTASTRSAILIGSCAVACLAACVQLVPATLSRPTPLVAPGSLAAASTNLPFQSASAQKSGGPTKKAQKAALAEPRLAAAADSGWVDAAADGLIVALADTSPQVRGEAAHALGNLQVARARPRLLALLDDSDKYVRYEADRALSRIGAARR